MTADEREAIRRDAERQLECLHADAERLEPNLDDTMCLSEWVSVQASIRAAERAIREPAL
jgi:hypothetical protein